MYIKILTLELPFVPENFTALGIGPFWQSPLVLSISSPEVVPGEPAFAKGITCGATETPANI